MIPENNNTPTTDVHITNDHIYINGEKVNVQDDSVLLSGYDSRNEATLVHLTLIPSSITINNSKPDTKPKITDPSGKRRENYHDIRITDTGMEYRTQDHDWRPVSGLYMKDEHR